MKFAPNVLAVLCFFSLAISLQGQSSQTTGATIDPSDSIYLQAVEILGFRPISGSKESSRLTSMEIMSHDAGAVLNRIPAVNGIRKGGGYGFDPVLRGFKYDQLGVLIDGIQTTTVACPNRMDPPTSQVSINALSSIEIHKGPYSLRYGNHIGGVINFQTALPVHHAEDAVFSRLSAGYESNGSIWRSEALAGVNSEKYNYQLTGSWHRGSDYQDGNLCLPAGLYFIIDPCGPGTENTICPGCSPIREYRCSCYHRGRNEYTATTTVSTPGQGGCCRPAG